MKKYTKQNLENIVFPLGGIGSGSVGLAGNGLLVDPEFRGRPNREADFGNTSIAIKAEADGKVLDWRMLYGNSDKDLSGTISNNYGNGCSRTLAGFRHFEKAVFTTKFPFANINFIDSKFPAKVNLEAYNPFIPSNDRDSSIPGAIIKIKIKNTTETDIKYTLAFSLTALPGNSGKIVDSKRGKLNILTFNGNGNKKTDKNYENISIATDCEQVNYQHYWFRGGCFDTKTMFINDFNTFGIIKDRIYTESSVNDTGTITASVDLKKGGSTTVTFYLTWFIPNIEVYWEENKPYIKQYYATLFKNSEDVARYLYKNRARLYKESKAFSNALFDSSMPQLIKTVINRNLCILKSTTCLRLEDGSFWAWEGVFRNLGSCMGTCQHVWNYVYSLAMLFPKLERGIRINELKYSLEESGKLHFRMPVLRDKKWEDFACVDGQMGTVFKCYREWKVSGDNEWLKSEWLNIKKLIEFAWSKQNEHLWDSDKSGIICGRQHHTLDTELYGTHAWLTGFYHLALVAGAEMAKAMGEQDTAKEYLEIFERGKKLLDQKTFNGEYYIQDVDIKSAERLKAFFEKEKENFFWDNECQEMKYQIGEGCAIDQVLAGWHADLLGLPEIFVKEHRKSALMTIYKNNFVSMHDLNNPCRVFAMNNEKGTIITSFPRSKPKVPIPYSEECMTGFEYAFAGNLMQCGMEKQALEIVSAIEDRYDGRKRNPFSELECGASYSRAMASYSFLLIYSGFIFDLPNNTIGFKPKAKGKFFWSVENAWGIVDIKENIKFKVLYGEIKLDKFKVNLEKVTAIVLNGENIRFTFEGDTIKFNNTLLLNKKSVLMME